MNFNDLLGMYNLEISILFTENRKQLYYKIISLFNLRMKLSNVQNCEGEIYSSIQSMYTYS